VDRVCVRSAIFARMSSDQKQQLVVELMRLGYYVGTCLERIKSMFVIMRCKRDKHKKRNNVKITNRLV